MKNIEFFPKTKKKKKKKRTTCLIILHFDNIWLKLKTRVFKAEARKEYIEVKTMSGHKFLLEKT